MKEVIVNTEAIAGKKVLKFATVGVWQFSIANEGESKLFLGVEGAGTPFLEIPPKPSESPAYPRVFSTNNPEIPYGSNFVIEFEGGTGLAHIITHTTRDKKISKTEILPNK